MGNGGWGLSDRRRVILICLVLAVVTLVAFWQVIGSQFINYDDDDYVTANPHVRTLDLPWAFSTFHEANWHPLTWVSHMIDYRLFGANPAGPHAVNLLLHIASTVLLFLVLRRMTGYLWRSAFVAALFAVHPLHVESVAWVAERKDVLSAFFWMLTMLAYVWYTERPDVKRYVPVAAALALGLMAKPMLVTLPFVLLILDFWPLRRVSAEKVWTWRRLVIEKTPLVGLAVISGILTFIAQHQVLAVGSLEQYPVGIRIANALVACTAYLAKTVYPARLAVFYPHPGSSIPIWQVIGSGALLIAITALAIRSARNRPHLLVGWLWYLIALLPVIGLVQVGMQAMADRYTYIPLVGIFIAVTWEAVRSVGRVGLVGPLLCAMVVIGCMALTWRQVGYWHDSETLFRHALAVTKNNAVAENNLGIALVDQERFDEAIEHHRCAVEFKPGWADAHYSLGVALLRDGQPYEAVPEFEKALALDGNHAQAHSNVGAALIQLGDVPDAVTHLTQALALEPDYAQAHNNLGMAYSLQGRLDDSLKHFRKAVEIDPGLADAYYNLAIGLGEMNRFRKAIAECRKALALQPMWIEAKNNLAWYLANSPDRSPRDAEEAVRIAEEVCRATKYSIPEFLDTLAGAYASAGRWDDAVRTARQALGLARGSGKYGLANRIEAELKSYEADRQRMLRE